MTTQDQRQEYRLATQLTVFIELCNESDERVVIVISHSLDISANGLRIITDRELPLGSIVRNSVQTENADQQFTLISEVKWQQPWKHHGEYLVGLALFESDDSDIQRWKEFIAAECSKQG